VRFLVPANFMEDDAITSLSLLPYYCLLMPAREADCKIWPRRYFYFYLLEQRRCPLT
jgi:hypothetical protein